MLWPLASELSASAESSEARLEDDVLRRCDVLWPPADEPSASADDSEARLEDDVLRRCDVLSVSDECDSLE